jgi:hypothetical protein
LKDEKLWWHGPLWLSQEEHNWPQKANIICTPESEGEKKISNVTALVVEITEPYSITQVLDISRYSSLRKLVRATALVLRFIHKLRTRKVSQHDENDLTDGEVITLDREELINAENAWVEVAQTEIRKQDNFGQLKKTLNIIEDENGMLRCVGRLENSDLSDFARRPLSTS